MRSSASKAKESEQTQCTIWKGLVILLKASELPTLDERLMSYGYKTFDALVRDFVAGTFPPKIQTERQTSTIDTDYLRIKIHKLMAVQGNAGLAIEIGILTGLRTEELLYIHRAKIAMSKVVIVIDYIL